MEVQNLVVGVNFAEQKLLGEWECRSSPGEAESCRQCIIIIFKPEYIMWVIGIEKHSLWRGECLWTF